MEIFWYIISEQRGFENVCFVSPIIYKYKIVTFNQLIYRFYDSDFQSSTINRHDVDRNFACVHHSIHLGPNSKVVELKLKFD